MSDLTTGYNFIDGEKGVTSQKLNDQVNLAVINPAFVSAKPTTSVVDNADQLLILKAAGTYAKAPFSTVSTSVAGQLALADATTNGMMRQVSGLTTDVIDGTNHSVNLAGSPAFGLARARSFQALGNSTFEVDQRNAGNGVIPGGTGLFVCDRWFVQKNAATGVVSARQIASATGGQVIPGTNFRISSSYLSVQTGTAQASLATGDFLLIQQFVEGPAWRELSGDVHSISLLANCSIALNFAIGLRDSGGTRSLLKAVSLPANVWTLITLPNLPVFDPAGGFSQAPGVNGYTIHICLGAGSTYIGTPDTWQTGNLLGVAGMTNLLATVGATFNIAFIQHEPGAFCTSPMDKSFNQNYDECLRYYCKSYDYATKPGTNTAAGCLQFITQGISSASQYLPIRFPKPMAKAPSVYSYGYSGTPNAVNIAGTDYTVSSYVNVGAAGFGGWAIGSAAPANSSGAVHYTADTGW